PFGSTRCAAHTSDCICRGGFPDEECRQKALELPDLFNVVAYPGMGAPGVEHEPPDQQIQRPGPGRGDANGQAVGVMRAARDCLEAVVHRCGGQAMPLRAVLEPLLVEAHDVTERVDPMARIATKHLDDVQLRTDADTAVGEP